MANTQQHKFLSHPLTVGIVGAAFSGGQPRGGVEQGPARLVEFGLIDQLKGLGWKVDFDEKFPEYETLKPLVEKESGILKNVTYVSKVTESVANSVRSVVEKGHLALTLGGDHSLAMGTVGGSASVHKDVGVIWVDAHADINTPLTTETGNLHGCPVSFLMGLEGAKDVPGFEWIKPCLATNRIVYIGLRDVDAPEKKILKDNNIKAFSMHDVDKHGIGKIVEMALDYLGKEKPIHLSFDVDALDPTVAPSTGTPVRGGLTFREGHYICESLFETGNLVAVDIMEVNPLLGEQSSVLHTIQIGCSLARTALGETLL
ncbi:Arginase, catabolizes arginine to ornithine and urea [Thoreauomyces humboldtii]|nr:Arginase, catabolizes arginine to ornithine and urea [Thoreauomyces humboldtii]